jgi:hypothetical protein
MGCSLLPKLAAKSKTASPAEHRETNYWMNGKFDPVQASSFNL